MSKWNVSIDDYEVRYVHGGWHVYEITCRSSESVARYDTKEEAVAEATRRLDALWAEQRAEKLGRLVR